MVTARQSGADDLAHSVRLHSRQAKQREIVATTPTESSVMPIKAESTKPRTPSVAMDNAAKLKPRTEVGNSALAPSFPEPSPTTTSIVKPINPMNDSSTPSTRAPEPVLQTPNTSGSSRSPIRLTEGPPRIDLTVKDNKPVPHMFQDRHSKLYTWKAPSISSWAPKPADGSTFTGHTGQDMYRMRKAKMASQSQQGVTSHMPSLMDYKMASQSQQGVPPHMPSLMKSQLALRQPMAAQQQRTFQQQRAVPAIRHIAPPQIKHPLYTLPPSAGTQTHAQGLQHTREYPGSTLRKRKMSATHDQGSEPEPGRIDQGTTMRPHISTSQQRSSENAKNSRPIPTLPDVQLQLTSIIERASLLTSLLRMYPQSADPEGLRQEIRMLASVQNQHLANWLNFEDRQTRNPSSPHTLQPGRSTVNLSAKPIERDLSSGTMAEAELRRRQDDKMRQLMSADAEHWQGGSALSVADVHAKTGVTSLSEDGGGTDAKGTVTTIASSTGDVSSAKGQVESEYPSPSQPKLPTAKEI
jgi:hypothetical protein